MDATKLIPVRMEEKPRTPAHAEGSRVGRVESPAGVDPAHDDGGDEEDAADHVQIPAQKVEAREGHVPGAQHHGQDEVAQGRGDGGDDEQKDHHRPVQREDLVVDVQAVLALAPVLIGVQDQAVGREQLCAYENGHYAAKEEEKEDAGQVHHADAFVVEGGEPRPQAAGVGEIVVAGGLYGRRGGRGRG
jgi:hypothetical protein